MGGSSGAWRRVRRLLRFQIRQQKVVFCAVQLEEGYFHGSGAFQSGKFRRIFDSLVYFERRLAFDGHTFL